MKKVLNILDLVLLSFDDKLFAMVDFAFSLGEQSAKAGIMGLVTCVNQKTQKPEYSVILFDSTPYRGVVTDAMQEASMENAANHTISYFSQANLSVNTFKLAF